ncbi:hypothetical protein ACBP45_09475 [Latilactobacillus sakei]
MDNNQNGNNGNTYQVVQKEEKNSLGLAGFILALVAFCTSWIPGVDIVLWLLGAVFSIVGLFKKPRGFAIAGTAISFFVIFIIMSVLGGIASALTF